MTRNEKTSARVAKIAAKVMAAKGKRSRVAGNVFVPALHTSMPRWVWLGIRALAASALTQAADKVPWGQLSAAAFNKRVADRGFDPRDGGKIGREFIPKSPQAQKAMRGKLGKRVLSARIKSKKPSSWPPSAKPPKGSP
jgi:hypothetical protein